MGTQTPEVGGEHAAAAPAAGAAAALAAVVAEDGAEEASAPGLRPAACELSDGAPDAGDLCSTFAAQGFAVAESLLPYELCDALVARLDALLGGEFDTGVPPDKVPFAKPVRRPRVEQFVNVWKGDSLFGSLVHSEALADWVAGVAGWPHGAEVLQDQIWCKPPGSGPIAFHRDTAYMGEGVVTLWITLDDLEPNLGPLEYARASHLWKPPPFEGYAQSLFGKRDWRCELDKAAAYCDATVELVQVLARRGGGSVHDGRTWHGSAVNRSRRPRRGLGIHYTARGAPRTMPTALARQMNRGSGGAGEVAEPLGDTAALLSAPPPQPSAAPFDAGADARGRDAAEAGADGAAGGTGGGGAAG